MGKQNWKPGNMHGRQIVIMSGTEPLYYTDRFGRRAIVIKENCPENDEKTNG